MPWAANAGLRGYKDSFEGLYMGIAGLGFRAACPGLQLWVWGFRVESFVIQRFRAKALGCKWRYKYPKRDPNWCCGT